MRESRECVLSRGPWPAAGLADAVEILFDDDSEEPYALHLPPESFDLLPARPPDPSPGITRGREPKTNRLHRIVYEARRTGARRTRG